MKKYLLMGILALGVSATGYAAYDSNNGYYEEKEVGVTAQVVAPIELETTNVDFGRVAQGQTVEAPVKYGSIQVKSKFIAIGKVNYILTLQDEKGNLLTNTLNLYQNGDENSNGPALSYTPKIYMGDSLVSFSDGKANISTDENGGKQEVNLKVGGSLTVPAEAHIGSYTNKFVVRAEYDSPIVTN